MNFPKAFGAALALVSLSVAGCQTPPPQARRATLPTYSTDLAGKAASCTAPGIKAEDGKETPASINTGGGGWCGFTLDRNGAPYTLGVLTQAPAHGKVYVHTVGDDTRIDYTPYQGGVGVDAFSVRLLPGEAVVKVSVNAPTSKETK